MRNYKYLLGFMALFLLFSSSTFGQATINPGGSPTDDRIIQRLTGDGLGIANPTLEHGVRNTQIATFTNGIAGAGFGMDEGVLFSTGNAVNDLTTRNERAVTSVNPANTGTDPNLMAINEFATFNTVAYSFDITLAPQVSGIRIVFQFGSEEYPDYVGSVFNDLFGFFVSGPGIGNGTTMENFAKLPSNGNVIAVNSVNGGVVGDQGDADHPELNLNQTEFYINNGHRNDGEPNTNPQPGPFPVHIEYNGITKAITRDIGGLVGGETYRFKVAIADVGDGSYDSGVLLHQIIGLREADLSIEKTVSNPTPVFGEVVTFNLKATNKDVQQLDSVFQVQATDLLPSGYTFISAIPSQGTYNPTTGLWDIGPMAIGGEEELVIQARVNPTGDYRNLVSIQANDAVDIDQTDNFDEASVAPVPPDPGLSFAKTGVLSADGNTVEYTFIVSNIGNMTMTGVEVTDPKITDPIILGATTLAPGESTTGTASYTVTQPNRDAGVVENLATVTGTPPFDPVNPEEPGQPITPVPSTPDPDNPGTPGGPGVSTEVVVPAEPSLSLVKTGVLSADGNTVDYTFTVTNTGNVTISNITVADPKITAPITLNATTLAPGQTATGAASYMITQPEKDAGTVANVAEVTGTPPGSAVPIPPAESVPGDPTNPSEPLDPDNTPGTSTEVVVPAEPSLSLVKTGVLSADGNTVEYAFTVTNTGNVTIDNITVADPKITVPITLNETTLAPGESATGAATYMITQPEKDAGSVANVAEVTGTPPGSAVPIPPAESVPGDPTNPSEPLDPSNTPGTPTEVVVPAEPSLSLVKTGVLSADGNTVDYAFTVINTGNVTIDNITVADPKITAAITLSSTTLTPGESATGAATYMITQPEKDAGSVANVAEVTGTPPGSAVPIPPAESVPGDPTNPSDPLDPGNTPGTPTEVVVPADPSLSLVKTGVLSSDGNTVDYTFTVTNTGNVTIDNIELNDPKITVPITLSATTLAPGQSATGMATYTVTQAEKDAGTVANVAEVTGTPPGSTVPIPPTESVPGDPNNPSDPLDPGNTPGTPTEVDVPADPSLSLVKTGTLSSDGNTVVYTFTVTNTGNVTMNGITIAENDFSGTGTAPVPAFVSNSGTSAAGTLVPGEVATYTATYTLTQEDKDAGGVENAATTTGTPPTTDPDDPATPITPVPSTPDPDNPGTPGDPGIPTEVDVPADPSLSLVKTGVLSSDGNTVDYTFTVTNTGNVTIDNIELNDPKITAPITLSTTTLAPGQSATGTATYTITQPEKDAGTVANIAEVTGTPPGSVVPIPPAESVPGDPANPSEPLDPSNTPGTPTEVVVPAEPSLSLVKTGVLSSDGNTVEYTFTVTNTGNVTIDNITVTDPKISAPITLSTTTLAPGQSATGTATYTITQPEKDAGTVANVAEVTGTPPGSIVPIPPTESVPGDPNNPSDPLDPNNTPGTPTEVVVPAQPSLSLVKRAISEAPYEVGDYIDFELLVTNTGNVTLTDVTVTDAHAEIVSGSPVASLSPGVSATVIARYQVTQEDLDAGQVVNQAHVTGDDPEGNTIPEVPSDNPDTPQPNDPTVVELEQKPSLSLSKRATSEGPYAVGSYINFELIVRNTGNVKLTDIAVTDDNAEIVSGSPIASLEPGVSAIVTARHLVTQEDLDAGQVVNQATVTGDDPEGNTIPEVPSDNPDTPQPNDPTVVELEQKPSLSLSKRATGEGPFAVGSYINFELIVRNTGNVTMTNVAITDDNAEIVSGSPIASLAPGMSGTVIARHRVTQSDVDAGVVVNQATLSGDDPEGNRTPEVPSDNPDTPQPNDPTVVELLQKPSLSLTKRATGEGPYAVGSYINFELVVRNTGNVTITDVTVTDDNAEIVAGSPIASLAPGMSGTVIARHRVTQSDVDAGVVVNQATVIGDDPEGNRTPAVPSDNPDTPQPNDPTVVELEQKPSLSLTKRATGEGPYAVGSYINFELIVRNTGNVTITDVTVTDDNAEIVAGSPIASLAPGMSGTVIARHRVTQSDVDAGVVVNQATVSGDDREGNRTPAVPSDNPDTPQPNDPTVVELAQLPKLSLTKRITSEGPYVLGAYINYEIIAQNSGNVTLSNVTVTDDNAEIVAGSPIASLAPGARITVIARHQVSEVDIDAGLVANQARVTGEYPDGNPIPEVPSDDPDTPEPDDATVTQIGQDARIRIDKRADKTLVDHVGERIAYELRVTNTGNVTLRDVEVTDPLTGLVERIPSIRPGGVYARTFWTYYRTSIADFQVGGVTNAAQVQGQDPDGNPVNHDTTLYIPVYSRTIEAEDDYFGPINRETGETTPSILDNDRLDGEPANPEDIIWKVGGEEVTTGKPLLDKDGVPTSSVVLNPDGTVTVAPGTPPGDYTLAYTICDVLNPTNCSDEAIITVRVIEPPAAEDVQRATRPETPVIIPITDIVTPGTDESPAITFPDIPEGFEVTVDEDGNIIITPGPGAPINIPVQIPFEVTDEYGNTVRGTITITVEYAPIVANDDQVAGIEAYRAGANNVLNVLDNDEFDGLLATLGAVSLTRVSGDSQLTLNPDGSIDVAPGTLPGTYTLTYRICEITHPDNCNDAVVQVTVVAANLRIPNVFTPNGDGRNDFFEIEGIEGFDRIELSVINRWGNEVYRSADYRNNWNGDNLNEGTYYYQIKTHRGGQTGDYTGWVLIKRQ